MMREVVVSDVVREKIAALESFLKNELGLSKKAASKRCDRIDEFLLALGRPADYPPCRFKRWRPLGYRCAVFEKTWIFAYEIFNGGVIVRDMSHTSMLAE